MPQQVMPLGPHAGMICMGDDTIMHNIKRQVTPQMEVVSSLTCINRNPPDSGCLTHRVLLAFVTSAWCRAAPLRWAWAGHAGRVCRHVYCVDLLQGGVGPEGAGA